MSDFSKSQEPGQDQVQFTSDADLLEIREEDTKPGKVSDSYRKWFEEKYGRKVSTPSGHGGETKEA